MSEFSFTAFPTINKPSSSSYPFRRKTAPPKVLACGESIAKAFMFSKVGNNGGDGSGGGVTFDGSGNEGAGFANGLKLNIGSGFSFSILHHISFSLFLFEKEILFCQGFSFCNLCHSCLFFSDNVHVNRYFPFAHQFIIALCVKWFYEVAYPVFPWHIGFFAHHDFL